VVTRVERQQADVANLARRRAIVLTRAGVPLPRRLDVDLAGRVRKAEDTGWKNRDYVGSDGGGGRVDEHRTRVLHVIHVRHVRAGRGRVDVRCKEGVANLDEAINVLVSQIKSRRRTRGRPYRYERKDVVFGRCSGRYTASRSDSAAPSECPTVMTLVDPYSDMVFRTALRTALAVLHPVSE
jgi:hypothetical protein